jgi:hypothetical protein
MHGTVYELVLLDSIYDEGQYRTGALHGSTAARQHGSRQPAAAVSRQSPSTFNLVRHGPVQFTQVLGPPTHLDLDYTGTLPRVKGVAGSLLGPLLGVGNWLT